nr:dynamin family protein [uncultured Haemophilus sp.]
MIKRYDTPGPNNSQDDSHKALTEEILKDGNYGLVLFMLNSTNLGTNDENDLLQLVQSALKNSPNKKIVFLLNKKELLENIEETITRVKENLSNIGFNEPLIFPISAYSALLLHKKINHQELDEDEMIDLELLIRKGKRVFKEQYTTEAEFNALLLENTGITAFYHYLQQLISSNHRRGQRMQQEVKFIHNPFKNETIFSLNGEIITYEKYKTFATQRLQMWISQFFQTVENTLQTKEFFVDFTGVPSDCVDVEEAIQQANATGFNITYQFTQIRDQNERMAELEELANEIRENPILNQIRSESEWNDAMDKYFDAWVIATMSSGKSTFINALLGSEVLPAFQEDTTASITKIIDDKKFAQGEFSASRFNKEGEVLNQECDLNLGAVLDN